MRVLFTFSHVGKLVLAGFIVGLVLGMLLVG